MKKKIVILVILIAGGILINTTVEARNSSEPTFLSLFIRQDIAPIDNETLQGYQQQYFELMEKLKAKQLVAKSDAVFLKHVFYSVHKKMLGEYSQYVSFDKIFEETQQYDCVTGTALYAIILQELGYEYEIHETDYHVYLVAKANAKEYLFESTDPLNGFAWRTSEIKLRQEMVNKTSVKINAQSAFSGVSSSNETKQAPVYINNVVDLKALSGLHYYNQALKNFNEANYSLAFKLIMIAQGLHPTKRIKYASSYFFAVAFED
jgi:hypothetical protein